MQREEPGGATEVSVQLSECGARDAGAVFGVLSGLYASDWNPEDCEGATRRDGAQVWSARFDVRGAPDRPGPAVLAASVAAELQGAPQAVETLRQALDDAFAVREELSVAGDQERQTRLRLGDDQAA